MQGIREAIAREAVALEPPKPRRDAREQFPEWFMPISNGRAVVASNVLNSHMIGTFITHGWSQHVPLHVNKKINPSTPMNHACLPWPHIISSYEIVCPI